MHVVIAEDSVLLRAGLTTLLTGGDIEVVEAVSDGDQLLRAVEEHRPDLALIDVRMPPTHTDEGIRAALVIRHQHPEVAILVLSQYVEERYATDLLSAQTSGVGYLLKDRVAHVPDFLAALRRVAAGGTVLDPEVVAQLLVRRGHDPIDRLTPRELVVLRLMADGRSNSGIADALAVSHSAVEKYVGNILAKLDLPPHGHRQPPGPRRAEVPGHAHGLSAAGARRAHGARPAGNPVQRSSGGRCPWSLNTTRVGGRSARYSSTVRAALALSRPSHRGAGASMACRTSQAIG